MLNFHEIWEQLKVPGVRAKLEAVGDMLQYILPVMALILTVFAVPADVPSVVPKILVFFGIFSMLSSSFVVALLKKLFNYTPLGAQPNGGRNSMPSGHTGIAFSAFWFLLYVWGPSFITLMFLISAIVVAISRVVARQHHMRDVIVSAIISGLVVFTIMSITIGAGIAAHQ